MAITMKELLNNKYNLEDQPDDVQKNLGVLLERINKVRSAWGRPMTPTSGLRSMEDHLRIYREKGITDPAKIPMKSKHLYGQAVDISDPNRQLQQWCKQNEPLLKAIGLWMESFDATPNWCHFQIVPYGSYKEGKSIWFNP
jgi:hypothetical protein